MCDKEIPLPPFPPLGDDKPGRFFTHCTQHAVDVGSTLQEKHDINMTGRERWHYMIGIRLGIVSTLRVLHETGALELSKVI